MKPNNFHPAYRPEIDGLRAVAVLAVVIFHAFPMHLPGGFVGVDVFFVISGFLISSIILKSIDQDRFSFRDFYINRTRRLIPALAVVLVASFAAGWVLLMPKEFAQLGTHILAGATFLENFLLWTEAGYFDISSELKPLMHLWSLGIEEQFYLLYPPLLWLAAKRKISPLYVIALVGVTSFALNIWRVSSHPSEAFFLPHTRFWELLAGGLLAYVNMRRTPVQCQTAASETGAAIGLLLIFLSIAIMGGRHDFPGWWALLPVAGAAAFLAFSSRSRIARAILGNRLAAYIGLISYPLYLWHWPLISFARNIEPDIGPSARFGLVILSVLLASATYHLIEKPIRFSMRPKIAAPLLATLLAAAALLGYRTYAAQGFTSRVSVDMRNVATYRYDPGQGARAGTCWLSGKDPANGFSPTCYPRHGNSAAGSVLVWGDSYAARLYAGISKLEGRDFFQLTRDSCPPILGNQYEVCNASNAFALDVIRQAPPETVVLFGVWNQYSDDWSATSTPRSDLVHTIAAIKAAGVKRIVLVGPAPLWKEPLPTLVLKTWKSGAIDGHVPERLSAGLDQGIGSIDDQLSEIARKEEVQFVSPYREMCNTDGCLVRTSASPTSFTTWDTGHFTTDGAEVVARSILRAK